MNTWKCTNLALALLLCMVCVPFTAIGATVDYFQGLSEEHPMLVDKAAAEIRLLAILQPSAFGAGWFSQLPGHHAVTWKGGKKAGEALLATFTSDADVYDAMVSIGAKPGNNLTQAVWDERKNPHSKAPDTRVEGSPVEVRVWWAGLSAPLPLARLLKDPGAKGVDLRFGGQKGLIPVWKSGCIVCLQSCPGAKISNHAYTIRDYMEGRATFAVSGAVPPGKRRAVVIIRLIRP